MELRFRQLDELIMHLKGLVLVRSYREVQGADADELAMFSTEIDHVRERLAELARQSAVRHVAA